MYKVLNTAKCLHNQMLFHPESALENIQFIQDFSFAVIRDCEWKNIIKNQWQYEAEKWQMKYDWCSIVMTQQPKASKPTQAEWIIVALESWHVNNRSKGEWRLGK